MEKERDESLKIIGIGWIVVIIVLVGALIWRGL